MEDFLLHIELFSLFLFSGLLLAVAVGTVGWAIELSLTTFKKIGGL